MAEALREAEAARDAAEVPVGAILVSGHGDILGRGRNESEGSHDPTAHAEIVALRQAAGRAGNHRLEGCVLVVTLEPCLMCLGAGVHARLAGIVYGAADPAAGVVTSQMDGPELPFLNHRPWHLGGILEASCSALLRDFFEGRREKKERRNTSGGQGNDERRAPPWGPPFGCRLR